MGLDQYFKADNELVFQLRKNYLVDDFFEKLFYSKEENGSVEFNCEEVTISKEDFENFKIEVLSFFSASQENSSRVLLENAKADSDYFFEQNIQLLKVLEEAFEEGKVITYSNWW
jgi:hypothetical protein